MSECIPGNIIVPSDYPLFNFTRNLSRPACCPAFPFTISPVHTQHLPSQRWCYQPQPHQPFSTTPAVLKKGKSKKKGKKGYDDDDDDDEDHDDDNNDDERTEKAGFDYAEHFDSLQKTLTKLTTKLKDDLSRLRASAANDISGQIVQLESLLITGVSETNHSSSTSTSSTPIPLRDLGHVTPKPSSRRHIIITIYEASHTKRIISAIQRADLNLQPVLEDPTNAPNVLTIPLPPPTREGREKLAENTTKLGEKTKGEFRLVRQAALKKLKDLTTTKGGGGKGIKVDEVRKEEAKIEKFVKATEEEVKKAVEAARKGILDN